MISEAWKTVVEAAPEEIARVAFDSWRREHEAEFKLLGPHDLIVDRIRSTAGELVRYRIRKVVNE